MKLRNKKSKLVVDVDFQVPMVCHNGELLGWYKAQNLKELNEEWEDYNITEPLIKDEEVRCMVRLWAKQHDAAILRYLELTDIDGHYLKAGLHSIDIDVEGLKVGMIYTVEELCGEED